MILNAREGPSARCRLRHEAGVTPVTFLNARQNAASHSYPTNMTIVTKTSQCVAEKRTIAVRFVPMIDRAR